MATSIIPEHRPLFIEKTYTCLTGKLYKINDDDQYHTHRKAVTKTELGITDIPGYVMAGIKDYSTYNDWLTVLSANPYGTYVLYLLNYSVYDIETTARITVIWVRSDMAIAG